MPARKFKPGPPDQNRIGHKGITHPDAFIGKSAAFTAVCKLLQKVAATESTVLLTGESGTGKGLAARCLHLSSPRCRGPFVSINCGAMPEHLLESDLFGHVRGAFTGAVTRRAGKFAQAEGGTLFLDEIGDMGTHLQTRLLKVLEEREYEPVGGTGSQKADVRIIAATNRDLAAETAAGRFRQDLFYRLYVVPVRMPPLRERQEDIPLLADYFRRLFLRPPDTAPAHIHPGAMDMLLRHSWPGNVRELRNLMERMTVLRGDEEIRPADIPADLLHAAAGAAPAPASGAADMCGGVHRFSTEISDEGICLNTAVTEYEKALILTSLEKTRWIKNRAARLLHMKRTTLVEKIKRYGLEDDPKNSAAGS
ncbi:hypothetical protein CSB20_04240 [bacterium DOLZORAL124_64_63]|nr:MAG: hypothetical protein CSB20_04240 [bacterium DOLZORAL124_64_63]